MDDKQACRVATCARRAAAGATDPRHEPNARLLGTRRKLGLTLRHAPCDMTPRQTTRLRRRFAVRPLWDRRAAPAACGQYLDLPQRREPPWLRRAREARRRAH